MLTSFLKVFFKFENFFILSFLFFLPLSEAVKNILLVLLFLLFILKIIIKELNIKLDLIDLFILLHLLIAFLGVYFGVNYKETMKHLPNLLYIVFLFFFFRYYKINITIKKIFYVIFASFIFTGVYGIIDFFYFHHDIYLKLKSVGSVNRTTVYAVFVFVIAFGYYLYSKDKFALLTSLFGTVFIFLTGSRMGMFSYPIIVVIMLYLFNKINIKNFLLIIFATLSIFLFFLIFFPHSHIAVKIHKGFHDPARIQIWISCIYIWLSHNWFFGIGMGNSIYFTTKTYFGKKAVEGYINNAHNTYLDLLLERGLLGLLTYLIFLILIIKLFLSHFNNYLSKIGLSLIFSSLIMSFMNITFRYEFAMLFMSVLGFIISKIQQDKIK